MTASAPPAEELSRQQIGVAALLDQTSRVELRLLAHQTLVQFVAGRVGRDVADECGNDGPHASERCRQRRADGASRNARAGHGFRGDPGWGTLSAMALHPDVAWTARMTASGDAGDADRAEGIAAFQARINSIAALTRSARFADKRVTMSADGLTSAPPTAGHIATSTCSASTGAMAGS
jgi:hypothetical protein